MYLQAFVTSKQGSRTQSVESDPAAMGFENFAALTVQAAVECLSGTSVI